MKISYQSAVSIVVIAAFWIVSGAKANEAAHMDYAGLPVAQLEAQHDSNRAGSAAEISALESAGKGCEIVQDRFDYAGLPQVLCSNSESEPEGGWSYLY